MAFSPWYAASVCTVGAGPAANFWAPQSSQPNGKPIRLPRACSIAVKRSLHRAVGPTISRGPVPTRAALRISTPRCRAAQRFNSDKPVAIKSDEAKKRPAQSAPTPRQGMHPPRAALTLIERWAKNSCSAMGFSISDEWAVVALGYAAGAALTVFFLLMQPIDENDTRSRWTLDLAIFVMSIF